MSIFDAALQDRQPLAAKLLDSALERKLLANSYLLTGRLAADKWQIAQQLAASLNCTLHPGGKSCYAEAVSGRVDFSADSCQNCSWIGQAKHPQAWFVLAGQGESGKISVEKARSLVSELAKTSRYTRVIVIPQAEQDILHAAPANALLKSIEESALNVLFLLFAGSSEQVLPTIVSRCQQIPFKSALSPGLWLPEPDMKDLQLDDNKADKFDNSAEAIVSNFLASSESIKSEFIFACRKRLSGNSSLHGSFLKSAAESQDLSKRLNELADEGFIDAGLLLDIFLAAELEVLRDYAGKKSEISAYLNSLAKLVEAAKGKLNRFVRKNNVLETFAFSLAELRASHLGEFHLAKQ